jgi:predicted nucleic acid-binding protein
MDEILLDSDILIDHLRGYEPARQYLKRFEAGEVQGYLSIITVAELAAGQMRQEDEEAKVQQLLALFTHIDLDFAIAWRGGEIRRHYQTRLADALIAATALRHNFRLATRNLQHFIPMGRMASASTLLSPVSGSGQSWPKWM